MFGIWNCVICHPLPQRFPQLRRQLFQRLAEQYPHFRFGTDLFIGFFDCRKVFEQIEGLDIIPFDRVANSRAAFVVLHGE